MGDTLELTLPDLNSAQFELKLPAFDVKAGWILSAAPTPLHVRFTPMRAGPITVPAIPIVEKAGPNSSGEPPIVAETEPLQLQAESALSDKDSREPAPLVGAVSVAPPVGWLIALGVVAAGLLSALIYAGWKWWKSRPAPLPPPEEILTDDEWAVRQLNQLRARALWEQGKLKAHYFGVSDILKGYIERRFEFEATERTGYEIITHLEALGSRVIEVRSIDRLQAQFDLLDRVKFTDFVPEADEPVRMLDDALAWVRATRRPVVTPQPEAAAPGKPARGIQKRRGR